MSPFSFLCSQQHIYRNFPKKRNLISPSEEYTLFSLFNLASSSTEKPRLKTGSLYLGEKFKNQKVLFKIETPLLIFLK